MSYRIKEICYTLQGEGANTGRAAVFCRFSGCNLWSGREQDRAGAICGFCDTDFVGTDGPGGGSFDTAGELADAVARAWPVGEAFWPVETNAEQQAGGQECLARRGPLVVCTGGEPLLQLDGPLVDAFHERGFVVAIETNGTKLPPPGIDWICVSPKAGAPLLLTSGHELKLVYPQAGAEPERHERLEFRHFFLQPMDGPEREGNTQLAVRYCLEHPQWRLSLQTQKYLGLP
jgi:7-carboxy-7-deazaguanine synthase (Cx14CxxC type)